MPLLLRRPEDGGEGQGLDAIEAGRGLVEQQEVGVGDQRPPQLEEPGVAEAQSLDGDAGHAPEPHQLEYGGRPVPLFVGGPAAADHVGEQPASAGASALGDQQVVAHGEAAEKLDSLERASDPEPGAPVDGHAGEVMTLERHPARVGTQQAEQAVEERRLARAVGSHEAHGLGLTDVDAHVVQGQHAPESLGYTGRLEEGRGHADTPARSSSSGIRSLPSSEVARSSRRRRQPTTRSMLRRLPYSTAPSGCLA